MARSSAALLCAWSLSVVGIAAAAECPGSGAWVHSGCTVEATASVSCEKVMAEMVARAQGKGGWVDPHNAGKYTILEQGSNRLLTQRTTNPKTSVGGKVYTDKQLFNLSPKGDDACDIQACSESQGTSVYDFSTNYCDIHNLYCDDAVCKPFAGFSTTESNVSPRLGSGGRDPSRCGPKDQVVNV